jgi:multimeric flavodoxin WrbA
MKISIVYESNYGHTATLAEAVAFGARSVASTEVSLFKVDDDGVVGIDALTARDATYSAHRPTMALTAGA